MICAALSSVPCTLASASRHFDRLTKEDDFARFRILLAFTLVSLSLPRTALILASFIAANKAAAFAGAAAPMSLKISATLSDLTASTSKSVAILVIAVDDAAARILLAFAGVISVLPNTALISAPVIVINTSAALPGAKPAIMLKKRATMSGFGGTFNNFSTVAMLLLSIAANKFVLLTPSLILLRILTTVGGSAVTAGSAPAGSAPAVSTFSTATLLALFIFINKIASMLGSKYLKISADLANCGSLLGSPAVRSSRHFANLPYVDGSVTASIFLAAITLKLESRSNAVMSA